MSKSLPKTFDSMSQLNGKPNPLQKLGFLTALALVTSFGLPLLAQNGVQQFSAVENETDGVESIDLATLTLSINIPILQKPGRGLGLSTTISHSNSFSLGSSTFGWQNVLQNLTGSIYSSQQHAISGGNTCTGGYEYGGWIYTDTQGVEHSFPSVVLANGDPRCAQSSLTGMANDGSGLVLTIQSSVFTSRVGVISSPSGSSSTVPLATPGGAYSPNPAGNRTDLNGNYISVNNTTVTDTVGNTLTIGNYMDAGVNTSGSGGNVSSYPVPTP